MLTNAGAPEDTHRCDCAKCGPSCQCENCDCQECTCTSCQHGDQQQSDQQRQEMGTIPSSVEDRYQATDAATPFEGSVATEGGETGGQFGDDASFSDDAPRA